MTRAEEQALKAYPPKMEYSSMIGVALNNKEDANIKLRDAFIKGYEKAISDISMLVIGEKIEQGVDIYTISRLCGHTNVETTKQYICCGPIISDNVIDYFNSFSDD